MTTKPRATRTFPPLPDPPEREPEDMTSFDHLTKNGGAHHLAQHFGHPGTTVVGGERYIIREPGTPAADRRFPDLLIAFGAIDTPTVVFRSRCPTNPWTGSCTRPVTTQDNCILTKE